MDAESSSNVSQPKTESMVEYPRGTDSEVLRIKSTTTLWLMAGRQNEERTVGVVRTGEFSLHIIVQTQSPILITICMMGDLQWPLTKDTPVIRVGSRSFAFAMPGLLYGLQISETCCRDALETLERVLMRFGHYEDHSGRQSGMQFSIVPEDDPDFWAASQFNIENITQPFLIRLGAIDKIPTCFNDINERVLRVMRMSAVTKMISKGVLVGGIDPNEHIELFGSNSMSDDEDNDIESRASATLFVFSDIVEAIEASAVIVSGKYQSMPPYEPKWTPVPHITFWNISKAGLIRILQVMVASATMNVEVMGDSTERNEEPKVVEPMEEDLKIIEEPLEEMVKFSELMEEVPNLEGDDQNEDHEAGNEDEVTAPIEIREIRFSIINEAAESTSEVEKNPIEELREACAGMEVA